MGIHSRTAQERQRALQTRNRYIKAGLAVGLVGALGVAGLSMLDGESEPAAPVATTPEKETGSPVPEDVAALVRGVAERGASQQADEVLKHSYREVATRQVGISRVRIAEIGNVEQPMDYEAVLDAYDHISSYLHNAPQKSVHEVVEYDAQDAITNTHYLEGQPAPVAKDITVLVVPMSIDIGSYEGNPNVFTETLGDEAVSFIRPDESYAFEGAITEACQGLIDVDFLNKQAVTPEKSGIVGNLLQEQFCNSLSKALVARYGGESYERYEQQRILATNQMFTDETVAAGSKGYVSMMPYLGNRSLYEKLDQEIPADFGSNLVFPMMETQ